MASDLITASRLLTLTTDFGLRDSYVGEMKGAILSLSPNALLVDISHEIPAGEIHHAAQLLSNTCFTFPDNTVHLVVVDPGVGGSRKRIILEVSLGEKNHVFVGPDNGVFTSVLAKSARVLAWELENFSILPAVDRLSTFDGRDIFAPCAALICQGTPPSRFGPEITPESLVKLSLAEAVLDHSGVLHGEIVYIDSFGNALSNISEKQMGTSMIVRVELDEMCNIPLVTSYIEIPGDKLGALINSQGVLELAANGNSAARLFNIEIGTRINITY